MKMLRPLIAAVAFLLPAAAHAQGERPQPLQELFFTEVVYPQDRGEVQITFSSILDRSESKKAALFPLSFEIGITDHWQVGAEWAGYSRFTGSPSDGLRSARVAFGTKYSFLDFGHSGVHVAGGLDVEFPAAGLIDNEDDTNTEVEPFLSIAYDVLPRVTLFGSSGTSFQPGTAGDGLDSADGNTALFSFGGLIAFERVTFALEYVNQSHSLPWRLDGSPMIAPSLVIHPGHKWELGIGVPIGVREGSRTPGFAINIIKEFGGE